MLIQLILSNENTFLNTRFKQKTKIKILYIYDIHMKLFVEVVKFWQTWHAKSQRKLASLWVDIYDFIYRKKWEQQAELITRSLDVVAPWANTPFCRCIQAKSIISCIIMMHKLLANNGTIRDFLFVSSMLSHQAMMKQWRNGNENFFDVDGIHSVDSFQDSPGLVDFQTEICMIKCNSEIAFYVFICNISKS